MTHILLHGADLGIGRVDYESLPQQTLMELLVADIVDNTRFRDANGAFLDFSAWTGIRCHNDGTVDDIAWGFCFRKKGILHLQWTPPSVTLMNITTNKLQGTVETERLPPSMKYFYAADNELTGTVDLANLPEALRFGRFSMNSFSGTLDLTSLPSGLEILEMAKNGFTGTINLTNLPCFLQTLNLSFNKLTGELWLMNLPESFLILNLCGNQLTGTCIASGIPAATWIRLQDTDIKEVVDENRQPVLNNHILTGITLGR